MREANDYLLTNGAPILRYRDVAAAVDWLCRTLCFERQSVLKNDLGAVRLTKLALGDGIVLIAPVDDSEYDKLILQPDEAGGAETQFSYFFVEDATAHYERVKAAGARIVLDHVDADGLRRGFACRDPEGHIWSFGTYNPRVATADRSVRSRVITKRSPLHDFSAALSAALVVSVAVIGWAYCWGSTFRDSGGAALPGVATSSEYEQGASAKLEKALQALAQVRDQNRDLERDNQELIRLLNQQKLQARASERAEQEAIKQLGLERTAKNTAELALSDAEKRLLEFRDGKIATERESSEPDPRPWRRRVAPRSVALPAPLKTIEPPIGFSVFGIE